MPRGKGPHGPKKLRGRRRGRSHHRVRKSRTKRFQNSTGDINETKS